MIVLSEFVWYEVELMREGVEYFRWLLLAKSNVHGN